MDEFFEKVRKAQRECPKALALLGLVDMGFPSSVEKTPIALGWVPGHFTIANQIRLAAEKLGS